MKDLVQFAAAAGRGYILEDQIDEDTYDAEPDAVAAYLEESR